MEYLYQYTTTEALKSILANRTIRLRALSTLDDTEESVSLDSKAIGNFVFVSSWTSDTKEDIAMWNMYGKAGSGVRIGLPKTPFVEYTYTPTEQQKHGLSPIPENLVTALPIETILNPNYFIAPWHKEYILKKVECSDSEERLSPKLWEINDNSETFSYGKMGLYKNTYWSFQKEWRYVLHVIPFPLTLAYELINKNRTLFSKLMHSVSDGHIKCPVEYINMKIAPQMFDKMTIDLGPLMNSDIANMIRIITKSTSEKIMVYDSRLKGRIRERQN